MIAISVQGGTLWHVNRGLSYPATHNILFKEAIIKFSIDDEHVATIREATNKAWILGNERFCAQIAQLLDRQLLPKERGGDRRSAAFKINRV
jgi:hypothetical protein